MTSAMETPQPAAPAQTPSAPPEGGPALWRGMTAAEISRNFDMRVAVPGGTAFTTARAARSVPIRARLPGERDVRYGDGPRQRVDVYTGTPDGPIVMFFHGGAWRYQSKEVFAFLAEPLVSQGMTAVLVGYDLHPQVSLTRMMEEAREALSWVYRTLSRNGARRIVLAGHSAGAQLAGMALAHDFSREGLPRSPARAAMLISGSYDLEPHRHHGRYLDMGLDERLVQTASPARNPPLDHAVDLVLAVGGDETPGYLRQATEFREMLAARGHRVSVLLSPGDHHFAVVERLGETAHPLARSLAALARGEPPV